MATGYEDIDNLMTEQRENLDKQKTIGNEIIDKGLEKTQNEVNKQKREYEEDATKTGKALYVDYKKASNPYGVTAEQMAERGLNKSGYAESSQVNMYNSYQKNVTELINNTNKLKAEADFKMNQAYLDADVQKAQNELDIYKQRMELRLTEYEFKVNRDHFEYQKERDRVADEQWEKSYQLQVQQADLQRQQAQQSQANWEREYQLSLDNRRSS
ncbi:MAG: hypothetical protein K1W33_07130 [Clostridia bacterium]